jgi:5-methylcytosine-specific restriction endonuclease McrA
VNKIGRLCGGCGNEFFLYESQMTRGRGKFCSRACSAKHRDKRWTASITGARNPLWNGGSGTYRDRAIREYGAACAECGYDREPSLLWVHHKDFSRTNHNLDNLVVLCIRCHLELHVARDRALQV